MRAPKVIFDIVLLALSIWWRRTRRADGSALSQNILGRASSCSWLPMLWRAVKGLGGRGRWAQRVLNGALLIALAFCVVSGAMVSGTLLPSLGFYATGHYFWGPLHAPIPPRSCSLPFCFVHIVLRTPAAASVLRRDRREKTKWSMALSGCPNSLSRSSAP